MINLQQLNYYLENFYGYGSWDSDIWFLGKEEGGGNEMMDCFSKIDSFYRFGRTGDVLLDLRDFHLTLPENDRRWFLPAFPLQSTWKLYIYILSEVNCFQDVRACRRDFQSVLFGRDQFIASFFSNYRKHAIIELLPLPNPYDDNNWPERWPLWQHEIEGLEEPVLPMEKSTYREQFIPSRIEFIYQKITEYRPNFIVSPTIGNHEYDSYFDQLINLLDPHGHGGWDPIDHPNGINTSLVYRLDGLKIIRTYQPTLQIRGGVTWESFFEPIRSLANE